MNLQEQNNCCRTTEDGSIICQLPQNGETPSCKQKAVEENSIGAKLRKVGLFALACLTSPCCTPLYVPIVLSLFAGTSFALWLNQNLFWVYGLLSLISLLSFIPVIRPKPQPKSSHLISLASIQIGEKSHVESTK